MRKKEPLWEQLEIIVADIQRQLAPDAIVTHNHKVKGRSGRIRKLDVSVEQKIGAFPVFVALDCKLHSRPVKMKDVEAFAGQIKDVRANLGVLISNSGFDAGAIAVAAQEGILLQTLRAAEQNDWMNYLGSQAWVSLIYTQFDDIQVELKLPERPLTPIPTGVEVYAEDGESLGSIKQIFEDSYSHLPRPQPLGKITIKLDGISDPLFVHQGQMSIKVEYFQVKASVSAKRYPIHTNLAEGKIIQDFVNEKTVFQQFVTQGFRWKEIIANQEGEEIVPGENDNRGEGFMANITHAKEWLRFDVTVKPN